MSGNIKKIVSENFNNELKFKKTKEFLICIDSDGCTFDSMEIKHKECFAPNFIKYWNLQGVSKFAREVWEYVNLYSVSRGCNRFAALVRSLTLLNERQEAQKRGFSLDNIDSLCEWIENETKLSNPSLEAKILLEKDPILERALFWSYSVNKAVEDIVYGVPPFQYVKEVLEKASKLSDLIVVSATPAEALLREWAEHDLIKYMNFIAGQEIGTKSEQIQLAISLGYSKNKVIKLGDAISDLEAARANGISFFPIIPGLEEQSWELFLNDGMERFINGEYKGEYEEKRIAEFKASLPELPPWK